MSSVGNDGLDYQEPKMIENFEADDKSSDEWWKLDMKCKWPESPSSSTSQTTACEENSSDEYRKTESMAQCPIGSITTDDVTTSVEYGSDECKETQTAAQCAIRSSSVDDLEKATFDGRRWNNPSTWTGWRNPNLFKYFASVKIRTDLDKSNIPNSKKLDETLPIVDVDFSKLRNPPEGGIQILWVGHSTVLIQFDGINILCDPVFSESIGPIHTLVSWTRFRGVPCEVKHLPYVDVILISHGHYDHLDYNSIAEIQRHFPKAKYLVPMGIKQWLLGKSCKAENIVELNWWEKQELLSEGQKWTFVERNKEITFSDKSERKILSFVCTPAQHCYERGPADLNARLWCSWTVIGPSRKFFFGGDTGYCDVYKKIGQMYGPFSLAALPIGGYEPRAYLHPQFVSPEEAVDIHVDIRAKYSLGIHWGTFKLMGCYEYYLEPPQLVKKRLNERALPEDCFRTIHHGEIWTIND